MPVFIKIAPQSSNLSGITSKGYELTLKGRSVTMKWGQIKSVKRRFYWAGEHLPQVKIKVLKSKELAVRYYDSRLNEKKRRGYHKLPTGKRILKHTIL